MHIEDHITIDAPAARIYDLAARVEFWPELLPHYRWVSVLRDEGDGRLVEMAATRDGFPVKWVAIQRLDPARRRIYFHHVRGISRGMDVEWSIEPADDAMRVSIGHDFDPPWPRPLGPLFARYVVCDLFVHNIAARTLARIKSLAEASNQPSAVSRQPGAVSQSLPMAGDSNEGQHMPAAMHHILATTNRLADS